MANGDDMAKCPHWDAVDLSKEPRVDGFCEECAAEGKTWVALRYCKTCGQVGCCDSSPNQHAKRHAEHNGHPVISPATEGHGSWLWCYACRAYVERDGTIVPGR